MALSISEQPPAVVQEWATCKYQSVTGPGTSLPLAGRFFLCQLGFGCAENRRKETEFSTLT